MKDSREKRKKVICDLLEDSLYVPMSEKELAMFLQVAKKDKEEFTLVLAELLADGSIVITTKGRYKKGNKSLLVGTFIGNVRGFGFVEIEGQDEDFYVPEDKVNGAFDKDKVKIALIPSKGGKRREVQVVEIIERGVSEIVGTYQQSKNFGFVVADSSKFSADIFVPKERSKGAVNGHKVVVQITNYGEYKKSPEGKVIEILGHINDPGVDILSMIKNFELPLQFPEKVLKQAERVQEVISEADCIGRLDIRNVPMVTIDGEDAKDLDDAISLCKEGNVYKLGVHIADVTNYVQENSALDREALHRGTSVYLVDRVIPMLPHALSNGICSLNEGVDRLALSCFMNINEKGEIVDYKIEETVICVNKRMSYTMVNEVLTNPDSEAIEVYAEFMEMFKDMEVLAGILREKRRVRGSIDFDFPESKIILDNQGKPIEIKAFERNIATRIIEDFMLAANETIAQHFYWLSIPFLYRTHDTPDGEKIEKLSTFIQNFGYYMKGSGQVKNKGTDKELHPKEIQKLMDNIAGTDEEALISRLTLRSMQRAQYTQECNKHFGLACSYYTHFTSPIRRYPDLQIHRIIKEQLRGKMSDDKIKHYQEILPNVAKRACETERIADEAERETNKLKKAEYMEQHLFETFVGVVSGITSWGIYVELPNTIEGMVHISKIPGDYYHYQESSYEMVGERTKRKIRLGEKLKVQAVSTDKLTKTIDFQIVEDEEEDWIQYVDRENVQSKLDRELDQILGLDRIEG